MKFLKCLIFFFVFLFISQTQNILAGSRTGKDCNPTLDYRSCGTHNQATGKTQTFICICEGEMKDGAFIDKVSVCKWQEDAEICKKGDYCINANPEECSSVKNKISNKYNCKGKDSENALVTTDFSKRKLNNVKCGDYPGINSCEQISVDNPSRRKCDECMKLVGPAGGVQKAEGTWTALGCLPTNPVSAVTGLTKVGLGLAGLFTLIQIIYGAYELTFSRGDTKMVSQARKRITDSVLALLFIIFSITILRVFGVDILHIPGFG
jgi:hypothetical protein